MTSFTKKELIQIDATTVVGILILLSLANIVPSESDTSIFLISTEFLKPIYSVTTVVLFFSASAVIEVFTILRPWFLSIKPRKKFWYSQIPDNGPTLASPAGLFLMGIGFAWLAATLIISSLMSFGS